MSNRGYESWWCNVCGTIIYVQDGCENDHEHDPVLLEFYNRDQARREKLEAFQKQKNDAILAKAAAIKAKEDVKKAREAAKKVREAAKKERVAKRAEMEAKKIANARKLAQKKSKALENFFHKERKVEIRAKRAFMRSHPLYAIMTSKMRRECRTLCEFMDVPSLCAAYRADLHVAFTNEPVYYGSSVVTCDDEDDDDDDNESVPILSAAPACASASEYVHHPAAFKRGRKSDIPGHLFDLDTDCCSVSPIKKTVCQVPEKKPRKRRFNRQTELDVTFAKTVAKNSDAAYEAFAGLSLAASVPIIPEIFTPMPEEPIECVECPPLDTDDSWLYQNNHQPSSDCECLGDPFGSDSSMPDDEEKPAFGGDSSL